MDWTAQAKLLFNLPKPEHFCNYQHCCECAEHDQTLTNHDVDSIGLEQLVNPGWDPLCFSSAEGLMYYMPALIRMTLDTIDDPQQNYLDQLLFHLIYDGANNRLVTACSTDQRKFISDFLAYVLVSHTTKIEQGIFLADDLFRAHEIWSIK
jgi:hypothetical protein